MNNIDYTVINYILPLAGLGITLLAQAFISASYNKYKNINTQSREHGFIVARKILDKNGLNYIQVVEVPGNLTDHYDPKSKVVRLSTDIYSGTSIAAASVAAHECGHAIQDKIGYTPMRIRSKLVPIVNFSTKIGYLIFLIGLIFGIPDIAFIGIILLISMLIFQLITLPVEFDASRRGKRELSSLNILSRDEQKGSATMLCAAAFTYVAGVLSTLLQILRLVLIINSRRNRR